MDVERDQPQEGWEEALHQVQQEANHDDNAAAPADATGIASSAFQDPLDPSRMVLSNQEQVWAQRVKAAIEQHKEIDNLADYWYAQLALIEEDNLEGALERASQMQHFRREYKILDTFEDACRSLQQLVKLFPGVFLSFAYNARGGDYCLIYDLAAFDLQQLKNPELLKACLKGTYYLCSALTPDMEAIRQGANFMAECQGFDWKKNAPMVFFQRSWLELGLTYPFKYQRLKYFHSGFFMNMINSLKKRFLPRSITDKIETGCQFEGRLSDVYLVPNLEIATDRMLSRIECTVGLRYVNEISFHLPTLPDQP